MTPPAANESTSLISEHDLPEWIRQIAAEDARKLAEAQVQESEAKVAASSSMPSHLGRRVLPGETLTGSPASSTWLNRKDAVAGAAGAAWDVTGATPPARSAGTPVETYVPTQVATPAAGPPEATDVVVAESVVAPSKRRRRGSTVEQAVSIKAGAGKPLGGLSGDRRRQYLVAAIVLALLVALAMTVL